MTETTVLRDHIREGTRVPHEELDLLIGSLNPLGSREGYVTLLSGFHALYRGHGAAMDWAARQIGREEIASSLMNAIRQDLGGEVETSVAKWAAVSDTERWGAAYVLEGLAIGAKGMLSTVRRRPHLEVRHVYLSRVVTMASGRWPAFISYLDRSGLDGDELVRSTCRAYQDCTDLVRQVVFPRTEQA